MKKTSLYICYKHDKTPTSTPCDYLIFRKSGGLGLRLYKSAKLGPYETYLPESFFSDYTEYKRIPTLPPFYMIQAKKFWATLEKTND